MEIKCFDMTTPDFKEFWELIRKNPEYWKIFRDMAFPEWEIIK